MPNIWFTADFHLGHKNIIRYCNRPFDTVEEMNRTIIERLNSLVKTNDILYFLGDFCIGPKARAVELRREVRCKKIFAVPGNHDKDTRKLTQEFSWLGDLAEVSINGQRVVLCHYAMRVWNHSSHGAWHLYGHSHGRLPSLDASLSMDVGVDTHDFRPWHFDEIRDRMKERAASTLGWSESIGRRHNQSDWGMCFLLNTDTIVCWCSLAPGGNYVGCKGPRAMAETSEGLWLAGAGTGLWFIPPWGEARQIAPGSGLPLKFVSYIAVIGNRLLLVDRDAGRSVAISPAQLLAVH